MLYVKCYVIKGRLQLPDRSYICLGMAAIRHTLQREVFQSCDERLLAFVQVTKALKKKKTSFLCIAVSKESPIIVKIYQVTTIFSLESRVPGFWFLYKITFRVMGPTCFLLIAIRFFFETFFSTSHMRLVLFFRRCFRPQYLPKNKSRLRMEKSSLRSMAEVSYEAPRGSLSRTTELNTSFDR